MPYNFVHVLRLYHTKNYQGTTTLIQGSEFFL